MNILCMFCIYVSWVWYTSSPTLLRYETKSTIDKYFGEVVSTTRRTYCFFTDKGIKMPDIYTYIYIYIYISSSCRTVSSDIPGPLSPLLPIIHRLRHVFWATSRILTQLLYVCSSWSSCFCSAICGVHRGTSHMSSSLLLQQCPACLVRLTWIVFVIGGRWPYSCCFMECYLQDLFIIARSILV